MLARADCTPSGQFAPSVIHKKHNGKPRQGRSGEAVHSTLDGVSRCAMKSPPTGNAPEGLSYPSGGGGESQRGEAAGVSGKTQGGHYDTPLVFHVPNPEPKSPEPQITFHKSEKS